MEIIEKNGLKFPFPVVLKGYKVHVLGLCSFLYDYFNTTEIKADYSVG